jgi:uncharacterized protein YndB with AHSA1/START domain
MQVTARNRRPATQPDRTIVIERVFDAPRTLVFKAWTDPEHAARWWSPRWCEIVSLEMDVRPGGAWRKCMRGDDGSEYWRTGVFKEVVEPERLVFTYFSDDPHSRPGAETLVTVTLVEDGGRTKLTLRHELFESAEARDSHHKGWASAIEKLGEYVAEETR